METFLCAVKIGGCMVGSALATIVIDATTNVPLVWLIVGIVTLAGGVWKLSSILTNIEDRLRHLERTRTIKNGDEKSDSHGD